MVDRILGPLSPAFTGDNPGDGHAVTMQPESDDYHRYLEVAWLFINILDAQSQSDINGGLISQVAAWDLFVDANHIAGLASRIQATPGLFAFTNYVAAQNPITQLTFRDAVDEALSAAQNSVLNGWTPQTGWTVVTGDTGWVNSDNSGQPVQEFMTPVAEPVSVSLMATTPARGCFSFQEEAHKGQ
jgi:hypothetical protein